MSRIGIFLASVAVNLYFSQVPKTYALDLRLRVEMQPRFGLPLFIPGPRNWLPRPGVRYTVGGCESGQRIAPNWDSPGLKEMVHR